MKKKLFILLPLLLLNSCGKKSPTTTPNNTSIVPTIPSPTNPSTSSSLSSSIENYTLSTHKEFIEAKNNDVLYIKAHLNYVTKENGKNHDYFFQDIDGGYHCKGTIQISEGKTYIIKGSKTYNNASKQHLLNNIVLISEEKDDIETQILDITDSYDTETVMTNYQGCLVSIANLKFTTSQNFSPIDKTLSYARPEVNRTSIRLMNQRNLVGQSNFDNIKTRLAKIDVDAPFDITRGIFINDYNVSELLLLSSDDITGGVLDSDTKIYTLVKNNIKINKYVDSSIELKTTIAGEEVVWTSSDPSIMDNTGAIVSEVSSPITLRLSATIVSLSRDLEYDITLIPHVETITEEILSPDLFISEVYEGSGNNNHAIEIYNNTGADVDLSEYSVIQYVNGDKGEYIEENLSGTLPHQQCLVIYDNRKIDITAFQSHINKLKKEGIMTLASNVSTFNSNDPLVLTHHNEVIDTIGEVGKLSNFMNNVTYIRKTTSYIPESYWNKSSWFYFDNDGNSNNYFSDLGYHNVGPEE